MLCHRYPVELGGETYYLVNNLRAWLWFERKTGKPIGSVNGGAGVVRALLWALMITEHPDIEESFVGRFDGEKLGKAMAAALLAMTIEVPGERDHGAESTDRDFRIDWYQLWAIGRFDLGLSETEFWNLSPLQLHSLMKRFDEAIDRHFLGASLVASAMSGQPIDDIMPTKSWAKRRANSEQSGDLMSKIKALKQIFPGRVPKLEGVTRG